MAQQQWIGFLNWMQYDQMCFEVIRIPEIISINILIKYLWRQNVFNAYFFMVVWKHYEKSVV